MKKLKCSVCGAEWMLPDEVVLKNCPNPDCLALLDEEGQNDHWAYHLSQDINHWYVEGFNYFPSVIAHEYWRLRELFKQRKVFAACFQLRDVMESVLKYEVLAICAWANVNEVLDFQEEIGCQITTRNMSFGSWKALAELILDFFNPAKGMTTNLPEVFSDALKGVINQYGPFIHWRNENIGHGALGLEEDEDFQKELTEMVDRLRDLFRYRAKRAKWSVGEALCQQPLYLEGQKLIGYDKAEQLEGDGNTLRIANTSEGFVFAVSPYIILSEGTIAFFDNQKDKNKTERQSYVTGKRKSENEPFFTRLMQLNTSADCALDIASSMRIQAEDELLNRLDLEPRFIKPEYLFEWLRGNLEKYDKGVFLLKMPRGTGKSTFTEKLNCLYEGPERLDNDLDVRTYHISRSQMIRQNDFTQHIEEQWAHDYDAKKEWMRYKHIRDYLAEGYEPAEALCAFLKECLKFTQSRRYKQQIMLVVDGLDEIDEQNLWDYLPAPDQLPENVYLLLTSRDPETEALPERTVEKLSALRVTEQLRVNPEGDGNRDFLKIYIRAHISEGKRRELHLDNRDFETLIQIAEYHVLPLGMLCKLVEAGVPLQLLPDPGKQIEKYIDMLFESYGEKESIRLRELISVLCSIGAEEPISIHEIAGLLNNGMVSLGLLGMMNDLEPLLHIQRGYLANGRLFPGENRYEPANTDVENLLKDQVSDWKRYMADLLEETLTRVRTAAKEDRVKWENSDSDMLVLSHARACGWEALSADVTVDGFMLYSILQFIYNFPKTRLILNLERVALGYGMLLEEVESWYARGKLRDRDTLAIIYSLLASTLEELGRHEEALTYYEKARTIDEALDAQGRLPHRDELASTYNGLASTLKDLGRHEEALVYHEKARTILEALDAQGRLSDRDTLAITYNNLAFTLKGLGRHEEALTYHEKARTILEALDAQGRLPNRDDLAITYNNLGNTLEPLGRREEALVYHEKARTILEALDAQGRLPDRNDIATTYNGLASTLKDLGRHEEALAYQEKARTIREELDVQGRLPYRNSLATTYNNLANMLVGLGRHEEALAYQEKARTIREALDAQGRLPNRNSLAITYNNLANTLVYLERHEEALTYHEKARTIHEALDAQGRLPNRNELATTYSNLASTLEHLGRHEEALTYHEKARTIREALDAQGRLLDRNELATTYSDLASTLQDLGRHEEALTEYEKARTICEELDAHSELKKRNDLALVYHNMAWSMARLDQHNKALTYYEMARTIREALDTQGKLANRDALAKTYHRIGEELDALGRGEEAAEMFQIEENYRKRILLEDR